MKVSYYPKAYFKRAHRNGHQFDFNVKELEPERCKIEKFGKKFQDKIGHISVIIFIVLKKWTN